VGRIHGTVVDGESGAPVTAKVSIRDAQGKSIRPADSIEKVGPGLPFFYSDGGFEVAALRGQADIVIERGTEYTPFHVAVQIPQDGTVEVEAELQRWTELPAAGWYPGNTHIHYDEHETRPYDRLRYDADAETYNVTVVSILKRWDLDYASNHFPIGIMTDYSTAHHTVDIGEENRHNYHGGKIAYGHVMFLRLRNQVDPVSRGFLVDAFTPDYPPLCFACDEAREQGGVVIWCHNGLGMEAPVAAVLGKLDAFNLFDPLWMDPEYDIWYRLLNCGISLPASTGTDWFVCSNNRVYVHQEGTFEYDRWLAGMKEGKTFITNGPALFLEVDGQGPGGELAVAGDHTAHAKVSWQSHYPLNRIALVLDGELLATRSFETGSNAGVWELDVPLTANGWIAARCSGVARDSFSQAIFAHTSPVSVRGGRVNPLQADAAQGFAAGIDRSVDWVHTTGRFTKDEQRDSVLDLFRAGARAYAQLARGAAGSLS
jgi:hypothetical protein